MSLDTLKQASKVIGVKQAVKTVEKNKASKVYMAQDADERIVRSLRDVCQQNHVPIEMVTTMSELGKACGIEVGAAAVAVLR
ncbi:hypothetical protein P22_3989 [Propionispora sp. 2/2-37]|uniref:ribosomal L7Ae/L30e/S12e/Gadd45 family protein n=1 Tax=Propionispora sp. 2/2-37 TaxID=1677858 RepID=UPI0006BB72BA|nr:ribosomal L7Ae/L30e/S12e/Gadd45 family protein [Propionispora sp. 2/2-37]CUH97842.1 hypothetical protein P22_3989 [Propionispora sp. 2/2-37]